MAAPDHEISTEDAAISVASAVRAPGGAVDVDSPPLDGPPNSTNPFDDLGVYDELKITATKHEPRPEDESAAKVIEEPALPLPPSPTLNPVPHEPNIPDESSEPVNSSTSLLSAAYFNLISASPDAADSKAKPRRRTPNYSGSDVRVELSDVNDSNSSIAESSTDSEDLDGRESTEAEEDRSLPRAKRDWLWVAWSLVFSLLLAGLATIAVIYTHWRYPDSSPVPLTSRGVVSMFIGITPLFLMQFGLGMPYIAPVVFKLTSQSMAFVWVPVVTITACFIAIGAISSQTFEPMPTLYVLGTCVGCLGALRSFRSQENTYYSELVIWLSLFVPINLKWVQANYFYGPEAYSAHWWAAATTAITVVGWKGLMGLKGFGYSLIPRSWKDGVVPLACLLVMAVIMLPIGAATGFIDFTKQRPRVDAVVVLCHWFTNVATVSILEEVLFRAVMLQRIKQLAPTPKQWLGVVVTSLLFCISRYTNGTLAEATALATVLKLGFTFIEGCIYSLAYGYSGNNILAPVLAHSITDTAFEFWLG